MSTAAQIAANQQNATRSTGPRTPEGKAASSANATRHGLTGAFRLLPGEDPDQFQELLNAYDNEFEPVSEHECFLVNQVAEARWKILRIERLQSEAYDQILAAGDPDASPDALIVAALSQKTCVLDRLERYAAQAQRVYHRAYRELTQLQRQSAKDQAAAVSARIDRIMTEPLPNEPHYEDYRARLQNEPNSARPVPAEFPSAADFEAELRNRRAASMFS